MAWHRLKNKVLRLNADIHNLNYHNDRRHEEIISILVDMRSTIDLILNHLGMEVVTVPAEPEKKIIREKEVKT